MRVWSRNIHQKWLSQQDLNKGAGYTNVFQAKGAKKRWQDSWRPAIMGHITETKVSETRGGANVTKVQENWNWVQGRADAIKGKGWSVRRTGHPRWQAELSLSPAKLIQSPRGQTPLFIGVSLQRHRADGKGCGLGVISLS